MVEEENEINDEGNRNEDQDLDFLLFDVQWLIDINDQEFMHIRKLVQDYKIIVANKIQ